MRDEQPEPKTVAELITKCGRTTNHMNAEYMGATLQTLSVENGKVTSKHGVLIGHHHYRCRCGHWFCKPQWEVQMQATA